MSSEAAGEAIATNVMTGKARLDTTKGIIEPKAGDEVMLSTKNIKLLGNSRPKPRSVGPSISETMTPTFSSSVRIPKTPYRLPRLVVESLQK